MKLSEYPEIEGQKETLKVARGTLKAINKKAGWRDNYALVYADGKASRKCTSEACLREFTYGIDEHGGGPRIGQPRENNPITYMLYQTVFSSIEGDETPVEEEELREPWVDFLINKSIYSPVFIEGNPKTFAKEGFILDPRYPFDVIYQACAAVRYIGDIPVNVKMWKALVDMEVEPNKAFIMSHFFELVDEGVLFKSMVTYEGHSAVHNMVTLDQIRNFLASDLADGSKVGMTKLICKHRSAFQGWGVEGGQRLTDSVSCWPSKTAVKDYWGGHYYNYPAISMEAFADKLPTIMKGIFDGKA